MSDQKNSVAENDTFSSGISDAVHYTQWIVDTFKPYFGSELLEVGLGAGNYMDYFPAVEKYKGVDYDAALIQALKTRYPERDYAEADLSLDSFIQIVKPNAYDTIFCSNVLEHIEEDTKAIDRLMTALKPGGKLLLLVPAFQQLYSDMDRLAGHHRRYTKSTLQHSWAHRPDHVVKLEYFNAIGGLGWWVQKFSKVEELEDPNLHKKIMFFDKYILPVSRAVNPLTKFIFGQSTIAVLEKAS
jgi:SAM-dependent methyltransferase